MKHRKSALIKECREKVVFWIVQKERRLLEALCTGKAREKCVREVFFITRHFSLPLAIQYGYRIIPEEN